MTTIAKGRTMRVIQLPLPFEHATIEIPLTRGQVAIVDAVDADLATKKWYALDTTRGGFYAIRTVGRNPKRTEYLHRVILERVLGRPLTRSDEVDHENLQKLDNRRSNLRLATTAQNQHNAGIRRDNKSGYKGVYEYKGKKRSRWTAQINANKQCHYLGTFDTAEEAHEAYKAAAERLHGEFARAA